MHTPASQQLYVCLEAAVARVEMEISKRGHSPILQAWLPSAQDALQEYVREVAARGDEGNPELNKL